MLPSTVPPTQFVEPSTVVGMVGGVWLLATTMVTAAEVQFVTVLVEVAV